MTWSFRVFYGTSQVGGLISDDEGRLSFQYLPMWKNDPSSFPISASLPLKGGWTAGNEDHRWFANLLPEGMAREGLCRLYGISVSNDAALLSRIGAECAGALRILSADGPVDGEDNISGYEEVGFDDLEAITSGRKPLEILHRKGLLRLSLAGAQNKWAVRWDGNTLSLPFGDAPSTHLLKFPTGRLNGLALNEAFATRLAAFCGFETVTADVLKSALLVTRYDRYRKGEGTIRRIHQEDFCQVLGLASQLKYQDDGGPGLRECGEAIRRDHLEPAKDLLRLVRWQIFNVLVGNADGHAKNLSRIYDSSRGRLAPFYDLVCTAAYDGFSPRMAMSVGEQTEFGQIRRPDWEDMASELGIRPGLVFREIDRIVTAMKENWDGALAGLNVDSGSDAVLSRIQSVVWKRLRRIPDNL